MIINIGRCSMEVNNTTLHKRLYDRNILFKVMAFDFILAITLSMNSHCSMISSLLYVIADWIQIKMCVGDNKSTVLFWKIDEKALEYLELIVYTDKTNLSIIRYLRLDT